jgi:FtsH-binding integral membrane protein
MVTTLTSVITGYAILSFMNSGISLKSIGLLILFFSFFGSIITDYLLIQGIESRSISGSFGLYTLSTVFTGVQLSPIYIFGIFFGFSKIITAFLVTSMLFGGLSCYAIFSDREFSPLKGVLIVGSIIIFALMIFKFIISFIYPQIYEAIDLLSAFISLALSIGFVLYDISNIKKVLELGYDTDTLMKLGIVGALHLFRSFVVMFVSIFKILTSSMRRRD